MSSTRTTRRPCRSPSCWATTWRALTCHAVAGVAADRDHADAHGNRDVADQVRAEDHRAGEDGDNRDLRRAVELGGGVVRCDLLCEFGDPLGNLLLGDQDAIDVELHRGRNVTEAM